MTHSCSENRVKNYLPSNWVDFDTLLGQVLGPTGLRSSRNAYVPASVWQDDGAYHLELDVPGIARDDVGLTFEKGTLEIVAERKRPEGDRTNWHDERAYGKATRRFALPESIDPESITAELNDGVLLVSIAKTPEAQPKRIDVN